MRIDAATFGRAPRDDPAVYPGAVPDYSFLFCGTTLQRLDGGARSLGETAVLWDPDGAEEGIEGPPRERLDDALARLRAATIEQRTPVLAYGSNAAPAQLRHKYAGETTLIPVVRAAVSGLDVVHAGRRASYGSVPATVLASVGTTVQIAVTFLDAAQLAALDRTERPAYERKRLGADTSVVLRSGTVLEAVECYVSDDLLLVDGSPRRLASISAAGSPHPAMTQDEASDAFG